MELDSLKNEKSQLIKEDDKLNDERCSPCLRFPKAIYFIITVELCERFNFYGMKAILIIYLTQHLMLSQENSMSVYHLFVSLCYITTIFGSFISDNYLGKYKTLIILSIVYSVGSILMSLTSIPASNLSGPFISLILIAFGTGGVKACVGPFGGDQIPPNKKVVLDSFFSMFYFAINLGALVSTILTPIFRAEVSCNGSDNCYPLAFGVPAALMVTALAILFLGRKYYIEVPIRESIYITSVKCIALAIKTWFKERNTNPRKSLLDYADKEYNAEFINDLRTLYRIGILYLPLPLYWSLFDQMGSSWTLQAALMDGEVFSNFYVLPDQMNIFNVIMIMCLIPIFDGCIYPILYKMNPVLRPLQRMTVGMAITSLSFIVAFFLQYQIEAKQSTTILSNNARLILTNGLPCDTFVYLADGRSLNAGSYQGSSQFVDLLAGNHFVQLKFSNCKDGLKPTNFNQTVSLYNGKYNFLISEINKAGNVSIKMFDDFKTPNIKGNPLIRLVTLRDVFNKYQFQIKSSIHETVFTVSGNQSLFISNWEKLQNPGRYSWNNKAPSGPNLNMTPVWQGVLSSNGHLLDMTPIKVFPLEVVAFYVTKSVSDDSVIFIPLILNNGSRISIFWQVPQYLMISVGEILVSITGLSFSYDQAPNGMKSLVNAMWFMTISMGDMLVFLITILQFVKKESWQFLIFGLLCGIFCAIFAVLAFFYKMKNKEEIEVTSDLRLTDDMN